MDKEKEKHIDINSAIALSYAFDYFKRFDTNLKQLMSGREDSQYIYSLLKISKSKNVFGNKKVKQFYEQNKVFIDEVNNISNIFDFVVENYNYDGSIKDDSCLKTVYNYILENFDKQEEILTILYKLKGLGFNDLYFDEDYDFTSDKYKVSTTHNFNITYMDNIYVLPNYDSNVVEYKTSDSNYKMVFDMYMNRVSDHGKVYLNSLVFDPNRLPKTITKETTLDKIISLKESQKDNCNYIRNSIDLSIGISDLERKYDLVSSVVDSIEQVEDREQLKKVLLRIKNDLGELEELSKKYDDSILSENSSITKDCLVKEKEKCLDRRFWASIDLY